MYFISQKITLNLGNLADGGSRNPAGLLMNRHDPSGRTENKRL